MPPSALLALAVAVSAPAPKETPKATAPLVGEWVVEKVVAAGADVSPPPAAAGAWRFAFGADGQVAVTDGRDKPAAGAYTADLKADPPRVDILPAPGSGDAPQYGVYKVDGDTLTLALANKEADRPAKFESPAGSQVILMVFKRAKKKD